MNTLSLATICNYPEAQPRSSSYELWVNGEKVDALHAGKADFAVFECSGSVELFIVADIKADGAVIKPLRRALSPQIDGRSIRFQIEGPQFLCLDVPGLKPLFIYANPPETEKPAPSDPGVRYYAAGRIYEEGEISLRSGETLYIEAGAVVRGNVCCSHANNVSIRGRGVLDGSFYNFEKGERQSSILFDHCTHIDVADIVMIEPTGWMLVFGSCNNAHVNGLKQIGSVISSDGIDICGSSNVLIENCCLRNDDDNIAIKAVSYMENSGWTQDVKNIRVRKCVLLNGLPGNAMEIGYELQTSRISDVIFEDIDVINAHGEGGVFSIHNGDRAIVENIRWENIHVEHYWDKLIDFRVVFSRYNKDAKRGCIRNIHLKNIRVTHAYFNPGCSVSLISGFSADQPVQNITLEDFYLNDKKVLCADDLELHTRNVENIRFL
ncbi:MAG TPA: glycosyl hydrolase family 28 protein [Rariglobus sp.]|nr:glycosyl hydrolase family 28 protein [Rariglobus sp.]